MSRPRSIPLLIAAVTLVAVAGCGTAGSTPLPETSDSVPVSSPPPLSPVAPSTSRALTSPAPPPPGSTVPGTADPAIPDAPSGPTETMVWVPAGDHRVPGTLALPARTAGQRFPAVLLLHGDLSNRNENGNLFGRLAAALSARGIASLRIDFAGSGDSEEPDLALDYPGMVHDATSSLSYLGQQGVLDPSRLAVLGLSRGGSIAATVAGTIPGVAALVSWSGAVSNGVDEEPDAHQEARENGFASVPDGDHDFRLSLSWFDTIEASHPLDDVAGYTGPVLAVVGSEDDIVPPAVSDVFIATVASKDKTLHTIEGADHGFTGEQEYGDEAVAITTDWLAARLVR